MERKKADFPEELLNLIGRYVDGGVSAAVFWIVPKICSRRADRGSTLPDAR
jgi:hypothetical protein